MQHPMYVVTGLIIYSHCLLRLIRNIGSSYWVLADAPCNLHVLHQSQLTREKYETRKFVGENYFS